MTSFRPHAAPDDARKAKDALDDALERFVRGDRGGLDELDPDMRATVAQMYRWADESGFRNEPLPDTTKGGWARMRWISPALAVAAAAILMGIIALGTFLIVDLRRDDPEPERSFAAIDGLPEREASQIGERRVLNETEAVEDIYLAFGDYRWPDAYRPTPADIADHYLDRDDHPDPPEERSYFSGIGHGLIANFHSCAWFMAWLDAFQSGDGDSEAEALSVMTNVLPYHPNYDEDTQIPFEEAANRAARGDPNLVEHQIELNGCAELPFTGNSDGDSGAAD